MPVDKRRIRILRESTLQTGPVVYWMSRDQRADDNWALLHAQEWALEIRSPLLVVFCLAPKFLGATLRQYDFMLQGLSQTVEALNEKNIEFFWLIGDPAREIPELIKKVRASALVTDFDPLKIKRGWKKAVARAITVPFAEVDAHNIVPCWIVSPKQEYGAYTLRPKIARALPDFLTDFPRLKTHPFPLIRKAPVKGIKDLSAVLKTDLSVPAVDWLKPGTRAGSQVLKTFVDGRLKRFDTARNDPLADGQSHLSPYLHFGQISAQRVALATRKSAASEGQKASFLEELIVRRELADNFCFYNETYDEVSGFPNWARATLDAHRQDKRDFLYSPQQFEQARTHDALWNAGQTQMVRTGKMHGYLRMYWAKKILEWSATPEQAMKTAITLNDRYELDGRDPNGYAGIAWSIGGVHDRPWGERRVFGMVRFMSHNGCRSKFDVDGYIQKFMKQDRKE